MSATPKQPMVLDGVGGAWSLSRESRERAREAPSGLYVTSLGAHLPYLAAPASEEQKEEQRQGSRVRGKGGLRFSAVPTTHTPVHSNFICWHRAWGMHAGSPHWYRTGELTQV